MESIQKAVETQKAIEVVKEAKKETGKFGLGQIGNPTPNWATWTFRIFFYIVGLVNVYIGFDESIPPDTMHTILKISSIAVMAVHGLSKMVGVDTQKIQADVNSGFGK